MGSAGDGSHLLYLSSPPPFTRSSLTKNPESSSISSFYSFPPQFELRPHTYIRIFIVVEKAQVKRFPKLAAIMISPDTIRTAIGVIGNGTALVLFLSPVPTFIRIWKKGSVEQYSPIPYVATLLNCMMWVLYGLPAVHPHSMLVITINGTGMAIQLTYVTLFLLFSAGAVRRKVVLLLAAEVAFVGAVAALVLSLAHTHDRRSMVVGILCVLFGTGMYAAPLSVMKMVIQTKSVEYMPLFLSLASLVNGICWTAYALIRFDLYITIPNGLGVLFAVAQLVLYAIYYKSTQEIVEARKRKADQVAMTEVVIDGGKTNNHASGY